MNNEARETIESHIAVLKGLLSPTGLFLASANDVTTGYNKAWLRDNFYTSLALEAVGDSDTMKLVWRSILNVFKVHRDKIEWAVENKPHESWQYIHARYNPETFEEYWDEWGNKQNDAVGAILYKICDMEAQGYGVIESDEDRDVMQKLVWYLRSIEYWHDPDNGMWEEYEEVHASSVAACLAGLRKAKEAGFEVPDELISNGEEALSRLLPRESSTKFTDLALLSVIYPYHAASRDTEDELLKNLEYHLEKRRGVIRYKNDRYYNKNADGYSEEAEWTMGFPWLAIIYAERGDKAKALEYLEKSAFAVSPDGKLPELYYSNTDKPNENTPLGWAESLYIVALKKYAELA